MLRLVLVVFRAFPKATGSSMQHECDMEQRVLPHALRGLPGRIHLGGGTLSERLTKAWRFFPQQIRQPDACVGSTQLITKKFFGIETPAPLFD